MDVAEMEKGILSKLSPTLRGELCYQVFGRILMQAPFLVWARDVPSAFRHLAQKASTNFHDVNDVLIEVEEVNTRIMFLVDGSVTVRTVRPEKISEESSPEVKNRLSQIYKEAATRNVLKSGFDMASSLLTFGSRVGGAPPLSDSASTHRARGDPRTVVNYVFSNSELERILF